jgi:TonB-linked SusC/RagA family outer membrane protein
MKTSLTSIKQSKWNFFQHRILTILSFLLFVIFVQTQAQTTINVSGIVTDEKDEPIVGANIISVGANAKGTITDMSGAFVLKVPVDGIIKVSYIGFTPKAIKIGANQRKITVVLDEVKELNEVVVTALGISREAKSLTYGRQSVDVGTMTEARDGNLLNMLAGKVSGVQFISNGGPTSSTRVVIRGNNSLTGNNQPLYVIDGIPIMNEMGDANGGDIDYGNAAAKINPDDVENIEVLKGANAAALYGSDAANGVILITTKKAARKNGFGVTVGSNLMFNTLTEYPEYQNVYGSGVNSRLWTAYNTFATTGSNYNPNLTWGLADLSNYNYNNRSLGLPMLGFDVIGKNGTVKSYSPNPDNISNMYRTGSTLTNSFSLDKLTDLSSLRFSYTNMSSDDVLKNFNIRTRHAFSLATTHKITDMISAAFNVKYNYEKTANRGFKNSSNRNPLYVITQMPRDLDMSELSPWKRPNGTSIQFNGFTNPYWLLNELSNEDERNWVMSDLNLNFKLSKTIDIRLRGATDQQYTSGWDFTNYYSPFDPDGAFSNFSQQNRNNVFDGLISFKKKFAKFSVNANAGALTQSMMSQKDYQTVSVLFQADIKSLSNNGATVDARQIYSAKKKQAIFGLLSTGYRDFAYMDMTLRNDWSSTLPMNNNSYFYYSVGGTFIVTQAFKIPRNILSYAKLRASYATVGNDAQFDQLVNGYSYGGLYLGTPWYASETLKKNPFLKPERTRSSEIGIDLRFLNNRITADITYYTKSTIDQIISANISPMSGYSKMMVNSGEIKNSGTEIALTFIPIKTNDFTWTSNINWSNNSSKVVSLVEGVNRFLLNSWSGTTVQIYAEVGKPYGVIYGNDWKKDAEGHILVDATGRTIQASDTYIGKVEPDWIGGWRNTFKYKDFDLSVLVDYKKGGMFWSYSDYEATRDGQNIKSLQGRDEFLFSSWILGETDNERYGYLDLSSTVNPTANLTTNPVNYYDNGRTKGINIPNRYYDSSVPALAGQPCYTNVKPSNFFTDDCLKNIRLNTYDASYIKLREVAFGYTVSSKFLKNTPIKSAKISAVGRNIAILYRNTPKGIDPEATSTTGNGQGMEFGFALPSATYGFDLKISF